MKLLGTQARNGLLQIFKL